MGFLLGPILGLVTNHTARILFEVSSTAEYVFKYMKEDDTGYTMFKYNIQAGRPSVIHLKQLLSNTTYYYEVLDLVKGQTLTGKFKTLNTTFCMISPFLSEEREEDRVEETKDVIEINEGNDVSISFLSCNDLRHKAENNLWSQVEKESTFYNFHLGDQVYNKHAKKPLNKYLKEIPEGQLEENLENIKEEFREIYRRTWKKSDEVKNALKNKSNLMTGNDQTFILKGSKGNIVQHCSYQVYKEYQRSLRVNPRDIKDCDYFLLQVGNVGYVVIDSYQRYFNRKEKNSYLGAEQIEFFKKNMNRLNVKRWVVISSQPIFQTSSSIKKFYQKISSHRNEITDGFTKKDYHQELKDFLSLFLKEDKETIPLFISGDTHVGGLISIKHKNRVEGYQLITGGINNHMSLKKYSGYRLFVFLSSKTSKIAGFTHKLEWNKRACNYLTVDFLGEGAKIQFNYTDKKKVENFFYTV